MDTFFAGEIAGELLKELVHIVRRVYLCRQSAEKLRLSVESLLPIITELRFSTLQTPQSSQNHFSDLLKLLHLALDLTRKVSSSSRFNIYRSLQLARKMDKVESDISRWIQRRIPVQVLADVHCMRVESEGRFDRLERKVEGKIRVWEKMELGLGLGLGFGGERKGEVLGVGVRVGSEKVRDLLVNGEGVVGICGIGGSGKTTMAREICRDEVIRSKFAFLGCFGVKVLIFLVVGLGFGLVFMFKA